MRPIAEATSRVASQNFSKKYVALGRIVTHWADIMGSEFAQKAQPLKLNYRKAAKGAAPQATLDIATSSADATILNYQKGLILERINRIFGDRWITDIRFLAVPANKPVTVKKRLAPLTEGEEVYLADLLGSVEDQDIKTKLENLGKAILTDKKQ